MNRRRFTYWCSAFWCLGTGGLTMLGRTARAEDAMDEEPATGYPNAVTPTMGGKQFWADELFFHQWHIQRNVFTGHYRLLDSNNLRHAWGTFEECKNKLEQIKQRRGLQPMSGKAVLVLHGLFRSSSAMNGICKYLREQGGYTVFNVQYPTTRGCVADHARSLDRIMDNLQGFDEINFVAHSLGNVVVRHYLADQTQPEQGLHPDPRIKRMVMLGPPNQGAQLAEALGAVGLFHYVAGASGTELGREWTRLKQELATPEFEFGILAGGRSQERGFNPLLTGDNDFVVSVETTRLPGATDFLVLPVVHSFMMDSATVQECTLRFLQHGYFISSQARQPLAPDADDRLARRPASGRTETKQR